MPIMMHKVRFLIFIVLKNVSVDRVYLYIERSSMDLSLSCSPAPTLDFKFLYVTMNLLETDSERGNVLYTSGER